MNPAVAALVAFALAQAPLTQPGPAAEPTPALPADTVTLEGPAVVFVTPRGAAGEGLREQLARLQDTFKRKKVHAVATPPTLVRLGDENNPYKRLRKVDFRRTPQWVGTVIFTESYEPRIHQGLDTDAQLLKRVDAYLLSAKQAR